MSLLLSLLLTLAISSTVSDVEGAKKSYGMYDKNNNNNNPVKKLFVFGDSYVDTGNFLHSGAYKPPSGITFPGSPAGRFGNGRVLTDYLASFLEIDSPTPYALKNSSNLDNGMNFAYGGTGIFQTLVDGPNVTTQIDTFEELIKKDVYDKDDLNSSIVLLNAGANDYTTFVIKNKINLVKLPEFATNLVKEKTSILRRIHSLGAQRIAVSLLQPIGCLPTISVAAFYQTCVDLINLMTSQYHNLLMLKAVDDLNKEIGKPVFTTLDLFSSFKSAIETLKKNHKDNSTVMNPLEPCCSKDTAGYDCGKVDDDGKKKYSLCENPDVSFFWDNVHPSQNGWYSVFMQLQPSLANLTRNI